MLNKLTRRRRALLVVFVAVLGAGISLWLLGNGVSGSDGEAPAGTPLAFTHSDARRIELAFNTRRPERLAEVIAGSSGESRSELATEAIPAGSRLVLEPSTIELLGPGRAIVQGRVEGRRASEFDILLLLRDGEWLVVSTSPAMP